ncbi:hypothetical protein BDN71DRAFT_1509891 [Pleurotus eryngii]|uniref:Uncharacterized protein n=1 Tax=Pleurotus eryngii TaxID=5323 RepID=A0A9P5ZPR3_PLEER|nr:hypothetical protein BDN71DRAFT_1509891 [Pleurotus eryngii]
MSVILLLVEGSNLPQVVALPPNNCKTIVDFFKGTFDVLEVHRWAVAEHKSLHRGISPVNIVIEMTDIHQRNSPRRTRTSYGSITQHDNCANLDTSKVKSEVETQDSDEPLQYPIGTPKFVARSVARTQILSDAYFVPMPTLESDIAANGLTTHGGHPHPERHVPLPDRSPLQIRYVRTPTLPQCKSVYWCIAAFVLLAKPLNNGVDKNQEDDPSPDILVDLEVLSKDGMLGWSYVLSGGNSISMNCESVSIE